MVVQQNAEKPRMRTTLFFSCWSACLAVAGLQAQEVTGLWRGEIPAADGGPSFSYQLQLNRQGEAFTGEGISQSADGQQTARFEVTGYRDGDTLRLQEIRQLAPVSPAWCLKYFRLAFSADGGYEELRGSWTARGCLPGSIRLARPGASRQQQLPFTNTGRWTGHLSQADRPYGFFYELTLDSLGGGSSAIVSEGAGGEARFAVSWRSSGDTLFVQEQKVLSRSDPGWRWCLKSLQLLRSPLGDRYRLEGAWKGLIEGTSLPAGACAPGTVLLEKPVLTEAIKTEIAPLVSNYGQLQGRSIRVDRLLKVARNDVRLAVWDNGIVDGDVISLFLNGERILHNHRVNKARFSFPVKVLPGENLLILHAENLGDLPPNTIAVSLDDGSSEQLIIMNANLEESGAILIQAFRR